MNEAIEQFHKVLENLSFVEPASPELQKHIRKIKRRQFKKILKKTAAYSVTFICISYIYFTLKKLGISVTIAKSAAIFAVSSSVAAVSVAGGSYYAVKKIVAPEVEQEIEKIIEREAAGPEKKKDINKREKIDPKKNADTVDIIKKRIAVQNFDVENANNIIAQKVTNKILEELAQIRGADYVVGYSKGKTDKISGMTLIGSVEFLNNLYTITAKVIDIKTLKVIYYASEISESEEGLNSACEKISKKISESPDIPRTPAYKR